MVQLSPCKCSLQNQMPGCNKLTCIVALPVLRQSQPNNGESCHRARKWIESQPCCQASAAFVNEEYCEQGLTAPPNLPSNKVELNLYVENDVPIGVGAPQLDTTTSTLALQLEINT